MGIGETEQIIGQTGVGETVVDEMGVIHFIFIDSASLQVVYDCFVS